MARQKGATDHLLEGAYDWAVELHKATGCLLQLSLTPTTRKGVWSIVARALDVVDGKPVAIRVQVSSVWPDAEGRDFGSAVMLVTMELDHALAQDELKLSA